MKKLLLLFVGLFITLVSFAQPSFYRAYSKMFGRVNTENKIEWDDPEQSNTLISVEDSHVMIYAKETTTIYITKTIEESGESLIYEAVDDDGSDLIMLFSKTDDGENYMVLRYTFAAVWFFFEREK
jgi:outer membrane lipoprotein-sorting protein